jgi:hypothetical protein
VLIKEQLEEIGVKLEHSSHKSHIYLAKEDRV